MKILERAGAGLGKIKDKVLFPVRIIALKRKYRRDGSHDMSVATLYNEHGDPMEKS